MKRDKELDREHFFDIVRKHLGKLDKKQVQGIEALIDATYGWHPSWRAYALATAWHETAYTMQPISEIGKGKGRAYGRAGRNGGQVAYGRGYVQLTWDENYEAMDGALGLKGKLIKDYELANDPEIAADILVYGMANGTFTGRSLQTYLKEQNASYAQFVNARRVINGTDRADDIAAIAISFQDAFTSVN